MHIEVGGRKPEDGPDEVVIGSERPEWVLKKKSRAQRGPGESKEVAITWRKDRCSE